MKGSCSRCRARARSVARVLSRTTCLSRRSASAVSFCAWSSKISAFAWSSAGPSVGKACGEGAGDGLATEAPPARRRCPASASVSRRPSASASAIRWRRRKSLATDRGPCLSARTSPFTCSNLCRSAATSRSSRGAGRAPLWANHNTPSGVPARAGRPETSRSPRTRHEAPHRAAFRFQDAHGPAGVGNGKGEAHVVAMNTGRVSTLSNLKQTVDQHQRTLSCPVCGPSTRSRHSEFRGLDAWSPKIFVACGGARRGESLFPGSIDDGQVWRNRWATPVLPPHQVFACSCPRLAHPFSPRVSLRA